MTLEEEDDSQYAPQPGDDDYIDPASEAYWREKFLGPDGDGDGNDDGSSEGGDMPPQGQPGEEEALRRRLAEIDAAKEYDRQQAAIQPPSTGPSPKDLAMQKFQELRAKGRAEDTARGEYVRVLREETAKQEQAQRVAEAKALLEGQRS